MRKEVNSSVGIIIIIVVSVLVAAIAMFIINDKGIVNNKNNNSATEDKNNNGNNETTEEIKYEKIENIGVIAQEFYDNFIFSNKLLFLNYNNVFKNGNKFNVSDLTFDERMSIVYSYVNIYQKMDFTIPSELLKERYIKLFAENSYKSQSFISSFYYCHGNGSVVYDSNLDKFIDKTTQSGCGPGPYNEKYLYDKVEQVQNKIKLYVKVGYLRPTFDENNNATNYSSVYSDPETKILIANDIVGFDISPYKDKLNTLVYTLVKDNNNYVLESIEVVK